MTPRDHRSALDGFAAFLRDVDRLQPPTIHNYTTYVAELLAFHPDPAGVLAGDVSPTQMSAWLQAGRERGLAESSLQLRWYAVHALYRYLRHEGYEGPSPLDRLRAPRARPVQRFDYLPDDADAILAAAQRQADAGTQRGQFDLAVMATLRYTGVRRGELIDADLTDLDLRRRELTVVGKGRKRRTIPLPHVYVDLMSWYLGEVRPRLPASSALLANPRAVVVGQNRGRTSGHTVHHVATRYGVEAGVEGPHMPHRWRHTYATHLLRKGVDVTVVQKLLGHTTITTTSIYLHLLREDLQSGVDKAFG